MANIHLKTSYDSTMPRYVGARAVVERVEGGVKITCKDYKGETEAVVREGIDSIVSNADGSLTFIFLDGQTYTTESLTGSQGRGISSIAKTATSGRVDTYTIYYDDGSTSQFSVTNGEKGDKGETPAFSIGTVETLAPTEDATATITGTAEEPVLNLGIPKGVSDVQMNGSSVVTGGVAEIDLTGKSDVGHTHTKSAITDFPTTVSSFTNDAGYITGYTETDPTVPSWAKASNKPTYTASEVGAVPTTRTVNGKALSSNITLSASDVSALPASTSIPSKTSDLTNDSGFITSADLPKEYDFTTSLAPTMDARGVADKAYTVTPADTSQLTVENCRKLSAYLISSAGPGTNVTPLIVTAITVSSSIFRIYVKSIYSSTQSTTSSNVSGILHVVAPFEISNVTAYTQM